MIYDYVIIGAGIVGLSTAYKFKLKDSSLKILILEKENTIASHQTGNNSGVIHSGIYYKPGSFKLSNCLNGYNQLIRFCKKNNVKHEMCGKIIVATSKKEIPILKSIYENGIKNGLDKIKIIDDYQIREIEPYCEGKMAIKVPYTGIIDYKKISKLILEKYIELGGEIKLNFEVNSLLNEGIYSFVLSKKNIIKTKKIINCAGLYSDKFQSNNEIKIIPFRGEYYKLKDEKKYLVNNLIYPVPDPDFPFLGVHFTRKINGEIEAGPNAVLAFAKEGYTNKTINFNEFFKTLRFKGFQKIALKYWKKGIMELYRSYSKSAFTNELKKLIPDINSNDLIKSNAGVRAQACDINGNLIDDFKIVKTKNITHIINSPSPAATSSLSIADFILDKIYE